MAQIKMTGYIVNELDFTNELKQPGNFKLSTRTAFNVQYATNANRCIATCVIDMMEESAPNDLNFKVSVKGMFEYEEGMDKKVIHVMTYDELFPYVRMVVSNTFTMAGLPPMYIQKIKMDNINVSNKGPAPSDSEDNKYYS